MSWLVTGGAGYIGAHVVRALLAEGIDAVIIDDLSSGDPAFVPDGVPLVRGSILDRALLETTLQEHCADGVIHVAGFKYAGVSVRRPLHTYRQNVEGTRVLLEAMQAAHVDKIVFSSSAAVYGTPDVEFVTENLPTNPTSPYGESKLIGEWLIRDQARATAHGPLPLRHTSLRYFNVVGSGHPSVYDKSPHNLFPMVFSALRAGKVPRINGDDYATPDGTNVRDYVHVADIAVAHAVAARRLSWGGTIEPAYNLGAKNGASVRQIMESIARVTGVDFAPEIGPRRPGDPDRIVATGELAARDLNWANRHSLDEMVRTAWHAQLVTSPDLT